MGTSQAPQSPQCSQCSLWLSSPRFPILYGGVSGFQLQLHWLSLPCSFSVWLPTVSVRVGFLSF